MKLHFIKRILDISFSLILLILFSPFIAILALLIYCLLGSPVIFKQQRPGLNCNIFTIYKFRTMTTQTDSAGKLLGDEQRLTRFGKFLRSTSLDEIPELFNVLTGSMSLVGPRPLLIESLPYYSTEQNRRHDIRPGITGLAQVNGRNALAWEERFKLDVWYVDNWSVWLDFKILIKTVYKVFTREGVNEEGYVTSSEFGLSPEINKENK